MRGPEILTRTLSMARIKGKYGNEWQYHSRSDHHSRTACWAITRDLLETCALLRAHVQSDKIVFGINHEMRDFKTGRKKDLDLVISTIGSSPAARRARRASKQGRTLLGLADEWGVQLGDEDRSFLSSIGPVREGPVGSVHLALEAKAAMTAHVKAIPRLHDELNSSHLTIHGNSDFAIAAGFVMVNIAETFVSPDMNKHDFSKLPPNVSKHRQPQDARRVVEKIREIPRRTQPGQEGFDALGLVVVDCPNDGSDVSLVKDAPAPRVGDILNYDSLIRRIAQTYEGKFANV